jgi:hypothetical protein
MTKMKKKRTNGLLLWIASALAMVLFIGGFNVTIDPFGYFGTNTIGYYFSSEREFKANLVRQTDYDAIVMGDSRIAFTDPKYIRDLPNKFLNAGFASATLPEMYALLRMARLSELKLLVLGVRYDDLKQCKDNALEAPSFWDPLRYSFSWSEFGYALQTLHARFVGQLANYHEDGTRSSEEKMLRDASLGGEKNSRYWSKVMPKRNAWQRDAIFSDRCLAILRNIRELSLSNGFEFVLFVLPYNSDIIADSNWDAWFTAPEQQAQFDHLRRIVPTFVDFANSPFSASQNFWLHDPNHFLPKVGAQMIEKAVKLSRDHQAVSENR